MIGRRQLPENDTGSLLALYMLCFDLFNVYSLVLLSLRRCLQSRKQDSLKSEKVWGQYRCVWSVCVLFLICSSSFYLLKTIVLCRLY